MIPSQQPVIPTLKKLQALIDDGAPELAVELIISHDLQVSIINGVVVDKANTTEAWLARFITIDPDMLALKEDIRKLSVVDDTVLIVGETGTGKELIARALHGKRKNFVALNCAGLPEGLVESELFGHAGGAFTGATIKAKPGLMLEASNGTLFLDEIGELPINIQAKLLRAIQERTIRKVGGVNEEKLTCRIVCATHRSLPSMIDAKEFRQDLYARISTFELRTKPLRERWCDIIPIAQSLDGGKELFEKCKQNAIDLSLNVRSLEQAVRRFKVLGKI